jgi:hypothetical protein
MTARDPAHLLTSTRFYGVLALLVSIHLVLAYLLPPGADTLWRLHIGEGILGGKTLYRDLIEVNPPLWFWGALPAAYWGGYPALVAINLLATISALFLLKSLLALTQTRDVTRAAVLGLAAGLLLVSVGEIGQREQAFLVASALWCAMIMARVQGQKIMWPVVAPATCFAAYGFALKHYFLLVPIALELFLIWKLRRNWRPFRPETVLLVALASLYAGAVVALAPDFLGPILELVSATYFGFGLNSIGIVARQMHVLQQCLILLVPVVAWILARDRSPLVLAVMIAILMGFVAILLQQKGWRYHLIAVNGLSLMVLAIIWANAIGEGKTGIIRRFTPLAIIAILFSAFLIPAIKTLQTSGEARDARLVDLEQAEPRDHHIAVLSTAPDRAFYVMARAGRPHWTRHYSMWMIPGAITLQSNPVKEAKRVKILNQVIDEFAADLRCQPPDVIVGEVGYVRTPNAILIDTIGLVRQNAPFKVWMDANYARGPDLDTYPIWRLKGEKPVPSQCLKPRSQ